MKARLLPEIPSRDECIEYLRKEGLLGYFCIGNKKDYGIFDTVDPEFMTPFAPEAEDLYRLHKLIRTRKVFNILEFGLGYSTLIMADALEKNYNDFYSSSEQINIRIKNPFQIYSVDSNPYWIDSFVNTYKNVLPGFARIHISYSKCEIGEHNGQICHFYKNVPNIVSDFIYLDGPSVNDVEGEINGISFANCPERTVMSGDLLKIEPTFLPGMMILVDGRTNNARFLANNFKRKYRTIFDEVQDITAFELSEPPIGKINRVQIDYSLGEEFYD